MTKKRPAVYLNDALVVVGAVWVALIGLSLARLTLGNDLGAYQMLYVVLIASVIVPVGWISVTALSVLVVRAEDSKLDIPKALTISGIAAVPLVIALVLSTVLVLTFALIRVDGPLFRLIPSVVVWLGVLLGVPGAYFAKLIYKNTSVHPRAALTVSLFLVAVTALLVSLSTYVIKL